MALVRSVRVASAVVAYRASIRHLTTPLAIMRLHSDSNRDSTLTPPSITPVRPLILPVLIAGAGLGGLALANSLSRTGIPYLVLERDSDLHGRAQGYRIALDGGGRGNNGGADGLRAVLAGEKFEVFERTCGEECGASGRVDGKSGRVEAQGIWGMVSTGGFGLIWALLRRVVVRKWDGGMGLWRLFSGPTIVIADLKLPRTKSTAYQIDRRVVRSILLGPEIAPHVKYSANVKSYTVHDDSVEAHLASGESVQGSLLVGADGIRSNIAAQLFASANIPAERTRTLDLGVRIVYGKAPLTPHLLERMNKGLHKGMVFIVDSVKLPPKERVMVVVKSMNFDHDISTADRVKAGAGDVQTPEDYVFFAMVSRKELWQDALKRMSSAVVEEKDKGAEEDLDNRLVRLTGQGAKDLSLFVARERSWDPSVLALLEGQDASQTAVLRTTSSDPAGPPLWESTERVTLLGDAVHCMPPTGGQGGNMALWDGALLGQELTAEWEAKQTARISVLEDEQKGGEVGWKWGRGTIRRYEDSMRAHTGDIVAMACIGATYLFGGEEVWRQ